MRNGAEIGHAQEIKANKRLAGSRCIICRGVIKLGDDLCNCKRCDTLYHLDCWLHNDGCATPGCSDAHTYSQETSMLQKLPAEMKANKRIAGVKCSVCCDEIRLGQEIHNCHDCRLPYHLECWLENAGCATYGCTEMPRQKSLRSGEASQESRANQPKSTSEEPQQIIVDTGVTEIPVVCNVAGLFGLRLVAFIIDITIVFSAIFILHAFFASYLGIAPVAAVLNGIFQLTTWIFVPWIYFGLFECSTLQATIGKRILELTVTDLNGRRSSFRRASLRYWAKGLSCIFGIGFLLMLVSPKKQTLHDILSGCIVRATQKK